jgi:hypothetical protein
VSGCLQVSFEDRFGIVASFCENGTEFSGYKKAGLVFTSSATANFSIKNTNLVCLFICLFVCLLFSVIRNDRHLINQIKLVHSKPSDRLF